MSLRAANISLQRTAPCGLAAELGSLGPGRSLVMTHRRWPQLFGLLLCLVTIGSSVLRADRTPAEFTFFSVSSKFMLAPDEQSLLFSENGPDGVVLKAADLRTGRVVILRRLPPEGAFEHFALVPGRPQHILAAAQYGAGVNAPWFVWLLSLTGGDDHKVELGDAGTDGELAVSPSGRYFATGTDYESNSSGGIESFPKSVSVVSLSTGSVELHIPVATRTDESGGRTTSLESFAWTADRDILALTTAGADAKYFRKLSSGKWAPTKIQSPTFLRSACEKVRSPSVRLTTKSGQDLGSVVCAKLFDPRPGTITILRGMEKVVVVKRFPPKEQDSKTWTAVAYEFLAPGK